MPQHLPDTQTTADVAETTQHPETLGAGRYQIVRKLGQGGFGTVYHAVDTRYRNAVAIKVLRGRSAATLYRFKREFRELADLDHPNLVRLYELSSDGWFVVMELLDGCDLLSHFLATRRRQSTTAGFDHDAPSFVVPEEPDYDEVRLVFAQLAHGLVALHAAQKIHRDIKPSNIMVTRSGRVVLLDFGLVVDASEALDALSGVGVGTPAYMSPEQIRERTLSSASDWYSLGATLHAVLTGEPPRKNASLRDGTASDSGIPDDLATLCRRLIDPDPSRRPDADTVLATLGATSRRVNHAHPGHRATERFVGREAELGALDQAFADAARTHVLIRVVGASGVGKTALLDAWLGRLRQREDCWILRGRCYEQEHVPLKAIDGLVDALTARVLAARETNVMAALPPRDREALLRMFPVLLGLCPDAVMPTDDPATIGASEGEAAVARARRDRALQGLRRLTELVARDARLVLAIEDAHWGGADGARALAAMLSATRPGMLVVVTLRPESDPRALPAALAEWLALNPSGVKTRDLILRDLDEDTATRLVTSCFDRGAAVSDTLVQRIVRETAGSPFLIKMLAGELTDESATRRAELIPGQFIERQLHVLAPSVRRLVRTLSLSTRPIAESTAANAAAIPLHELQEALRVARRRRLVTGMVVDGVYLVEVDHARVRDEVARSIDPRESRALHGALAVALVETGHGEPEHLLPHYLGADDRSRATDAAATLARRAESAFAFERAAELYALLLDLGMDGDRAGLHERRGVALANAGRSAEAADALQKALAGVDNALEAVAGEERRRRRRLLRRSGELWLRSGYVAKGTDLLREVLAGMQIEMPTSERDALRSAAWRRLRLLVRGMEFAPRPEREIPADTLERLDALWAVTTSLVMLRFLIADALGLQHFLEALDAGEPSRVLRSMALEVCFEALIGGRYFNRRCEQMIRRMDGFAREQGDEYFRAWATMCRGVAGWFRGDWQAAWQACHDAAGVYARQSRANVWELAVCDVYGLSAATYLGGIRELAAAVPERHRQARERGDLYATANLAFYESFLFLVRDAPDDAITCAERSLEPFIDQQFLANRYGIAYAIVQGELYRGRPDAALRIIERDWRDWETTGMLRVQCARVEARYLRARTVIAVLAHEPRGRAGRHTRALQRVLDEDLRALHRDVIAPAEPLTQSILAGRASLGGDWRQALRHLRKAQEGFARCDMSLHEAAAMRHIAAISQLRRDVELAERTQIRLSQEGVVNPAHFHRLTIPGFP